MSKHINFQPTDWDEYAKCYDTLLALKPYTQLLDQVTKTLNLRGHDRLLDVGCGTGNLLRHIAEQSQSPRLVGIDFSASMLKRAKTKCQPHDVSLLFTDLSKPLPFADCSFTRLASVNVLYTLADPEFSLRELYRVLQPGSKAVIATPKRSFDNGLILKAHCRSNHPDEFWLNAHASPEREAFLLRTAIKDESLVEQMLYVAENNRRIAKTATFNFFTAEELESLCVACGFTVLRSTTAYAEQDIIIQVGKETS